MKHDRTWPEWFIWHIRQIPFQLLHMRELAESTITAQDTTAVRVSGSSEKARLPMRVEPADDADQLWAILVITTQHILEHVGGAAPQPLRKRMWQGLNEPQGLPLCTPTEAFAMAAQVVRWLQAATPTIERAGELHETIDYLIQTIRKLRSRYPRAEPTFKAYRPRPCPLCQEHTIAPQWGPQGLQGFKCDNCEQTWNQEGKQ